MFLLSIINVPLSRDSDGNTLNNYLSSMATAQQRVKELEALYSTLLTGIIIDRSIYFNPIPGVNYGDPNQIKQELDSARGYILDLITQGQSGTEDTGDITARISEVERREQASQIRMNDLQSLQTALSNGTAFLDANGRLRIISGVDNTSTYSVQRAIDNANLYGSELTTSYDFWTQILNARMEANKTGDINLDGQVNNNDFLMLQDAIAGNTQLNDTQVKASDMNEDGVLNDEDLAILNPNFTSEGDSNNSIKLTSDWKGYTGEDHGLERLDDLKMDSDLATQRFMADERIQYLESKLEALKKQSPSEDVNKEISSTLQELDREKVRFGMLNSLINKS